MSRAIIGFGRSAVALGLTGAVLLTLLASAAVASGPGDMRLAQAAAPAAAPPGQGDQTAELQRSLQITPGQQPQFDAFAQAMRQNEAAMDALVKRYPPGQQRNAVAELEAQAQAADIEAQGLHRLLPPFQALYAVLNEQQKRTADQVFAGPPPGNQAPAGR